MSRKIICDVCDGECENQGAAINFKRIDICEYCQIALGEVLMEPKGIKGLTGEAGLYGAVGPGRVFFQRDAKAELLKAAAGVRKERDRTFLSNLEQEMDFTGVWRTSTGALIRVIKEKDSIYPWLGELKEQFIGLTAGSQFWIDKQGNVTNSPYLGFLAEKQRGEEAI